MVNKIPFSSSPFYQWSGTVWGKIVLHGAFWVLYYLYLFSDLLNTAQQDCDFSCLVEDNTVYLACTVLAVYTNAYFFVPNFLYQRRFALYVLSFLSIIFCVAGIKMYVYNFVLEAGEAQTEGIWTTLFFWYFRDLFEVSAISSIKIASDWIITSNKLREKEQKELEAEFRFLKAQVNPHFIFNTLNNIYVLTQKSPPKAGESILHLSNMLRYRIYEPGDTGNTIENEIQCIKDLIELEKLRLGPDTKIDFTVEEKQANHRVEPLLFIPFVENAFKHCTATHKGKWIKINFRLGKDEIEFSCSNSHVKNVGKAEAQGIGIKNVMSRLKLIYPGSHSLILNHEEDSYSVYLSIKP